MNSDQNFSEDPSLKPLRQKSTLNKGNIMCIRIRDLESSKLFAEI